MQGIVIYIRYNWVQHRSVAVRSVRHNGLLYIGQTVHFSTVESSKIEWSVFHQTGKKIKKKSRFNSTLKNVARYTGLLLAPAKDFGFRQSHFFCGKKIQLVLLFWPILCHFWCSVLTLLTFSSTLIVILKRTKKKI